jgi:hypothetical protein
MKRPLWLSQLVCEDDANSVVCPVRVIGLCGTAALIVYAGFMLVRHGQFDAMAFGTGIATISGSVGVGAGVKAHLGG